MASGRVPNTKRILFNRYHLPFLCKALGGWSQRGTRFLSTQLPRLPEVGQHAPPSLSKLPDCMGCGQADVSNLH